MNAGARSPGDIVALLAVLALAVAAGWRCVGYGLWSYGEPAPGLFPLLASAVTALFAVIALAACFSGAAPEAEFDPEAAQQDGPMLWGKLALYGAVVLAWPWLMVPLGFVVSTALALFVILRLAEGMGWVAVSVVLVAAVGLSWLVFDRLLGVPLPAGLLGA